MSRIDRLYEESEPHFPRWETIKDCVDQFIDLMLNYRQSGHPGGSRSKTHALVATLLGGVMRWDIRRPDAPFGDRFVLVAGHTVPLVYATLAVLNESLRARHRETGDPRFLIRKEEERALYAEHLLGFRRNGGLSGHAEMEGRTLFLKFNTGPSGHGSPAAAGEALALRRAGAAGVRVFAFEGEGGHSAGAIHETKNSAWGLGLDNLIYVLDWNDFGIDDHRVSSVIAGGPEDWFGAYGWRVRGAEEGSAWGPVTRALLEIVHDPDPGGRPGAVWIRTRKGRGYLKYDNKSHGSPHAANSELFWETKREFAEKYGVRFEGFGRPLPSDPEAVREQAAANYQIVLDVIRKDRDLLHYLTDRLVEIGESVPDRLEGFRIPEERNPAEDETFFDCRAYPETIWAKPGEKKPNRAALASWGAWINSASRERYGRPLFIACSADLADSTNISGFGNGWEGSEGWGWYERETNPEGALLPQEITEFTNAGIMAGLASVNFSREPEKRFNGFWGACSTYGSFSYLKYGPMRLFSQLAQDCDLRVGRVLWVAGHSGPETADDSRTHFGIFAPGVTDLFPRGRVVNLHPWEYNEVPVVLAEAFRGDWPIVVLHLTRPPVEIPDREALGMAHHFEAARGAYLIRPYREDKPRGGVLFVQGTSTTANLIRVLPELDREGLNVKIVAAISRELFDRQPEPYRNGLVSDADWIDSTVITNRSRLLAGPWLAHRDAEAYAISSDWDDRWRTGGTLEEVCEEARISPEWILRGIERFVRDREKRLGRIAGALARARKE
ncbi:MAG: transketolase [Candidatus Eisenbacteria bacterium]|nr:transketolase [Candidatus Eisenbacteria bacterium]